MKNKFYSTIMLFPVLDLTVQWETAMMSLTGGGGTNSEERGVTWNGRERGRRGDEMTGLTGEQTSTRTHTTMLLCAQTLNHDSVCVYVCVCRDWDRGRERRRDYNRGHRERFSPPRHISPQHKRMRRDWWVCMCAGRCCCCTGQAKISSAIKSFKKRRDELIMICI